MLASNLHYSTIARCYREIVTEHVQAASYMHIHHAICTRPCSTSAHMQVHVLEHMEQVLPMLECVSAHILHLAARACLGGYGSVQVMSAILTETRCIKFPGFDKVWVIKSSDAVKCDDSVYIRMDPRSHTLRGLVCETMKSSILKSLTASIGLESMQRLRNEAQALMLAPPKCVGQMLFDDAEHQQKKSRMSRTAMKTARTEASSLDISITVDGEPHMVQVLRPVHPRDNVFILYEPDNITAVVKYIRQCGFADNTNLMTVPRDPAVPQGVHRLMRNKMELFQVVYRKQDGTKGRKCFADIESATNWQTSNIAICTADGPDDDLHEEPCCEHIADSESPDATGNGATPKTEADDEQDEASMDMHARSSSHGE